MNLAEMPRAVRRGEDSTASPELPDGRAGAPNTCVVCVVVYLPPVSTRLNSLELLDCHFVSRTCMWLHGFRALWLLYMKTSSYHLLECLSIRIFVPGFMASQVLHVMYNIYPLFFFFFCLHCAKKSLAKRLFAHCKNLLA